MFNKSWFLSDINVYKKCFLFPALDINSRITKALLVLISNNDIVSLCQGKCFTCVLGVRPFLFSIESYKKKKVNAVFVNMNKSHFVKHIRLFIFQYLFVCRRVIDSTVSKTTYKLLGCSTTIILHSVKLKKVGFMHLWARYCQIKSCGEFLIYGSKFLIFWTFLNQVSKTLFLLCNIIKAQS